MKHLLRSLVALAWFGGLTAAAPAHYQMLLPDSASVKRGETVTLTYQWGHPFEHQLFEAPTPRSLLVHSPGGVTTIDLGKGLKKVALPAGEGKTVTAYRCRFTPEQRGDFVLSLDLPPIWIEDDQEFLHDRAKVVLHVQAQRGWDNDFWTSEHPLDLVPLTRPYGLQPGMVFQAQARLEGKPLANALVEIERYNPVAPVELPADEHITRTAKTDPNGVVTCTLPEAGWWGITAKHDAGQRQHDGKAYPVRQRTTLWVYVDEKVSSKDSK